jgi:hypothetical protein
VLTGKAAAVAVVDHRAETVLQEIGAAMVALE